MRVELRCGSRGAADPITWSLSFLLTFFCLRCDCLVGPRWFCCSKRAVVGAGVSELSLSSSSFSLTAWFPRRRCWLLHSRWPAQQVPLLPSLLHWNQIPVCSILPISSRILHDLERRIVWAKTQNLWTTFHDTVQWQAQILSSSPFVSNHTRPRDGSSNFIA